MRSWYIFCIVMLGGCYQTVVKNISPGGVVELTNDTDEVLEIFAEGQRVAVIEPQETIRVDKLPLGECKLNAIGNLTSHEIETIVNLEEGKPVKWRFTESESHKEKMKMLPTGRIKAINMAKEPVRVFIDNSPREMIWALGEAEYSGIRVGTHDLKAEGIKSGFSINHKVVVSQKVTPVFVIHPPMGAISLKNRSGRSCLVNVRGVRSVKIDQLDTYIIDQLSQGNYQVFVTDLLGRRIWSGDVDVKSGEVKEIEIPPGVGRLVVVSDLDDLVTIVGDGVKLGECLGHGAVEFRGLPVGETRLQAYNPEGEIVGRVKLAIPEDGQAIWLLKKGQEKEGLAEEGSLLVNNTSSEVIIVKIDNWVRGEILPNGRRLFTGLVPGNHRVYAAGKQSGEVFKSEIHVSEGEQVVVDVALPLAVLEVKNERKEDVLVNIDEREIGRIRPLQTQLFKIEAGTHTVELRGLLTLDGVVEKIDLPSGSITTKVFRSKYGKIVITNLFSEPLSIFVGERKIGVILPSDKVVLEDIEPGTYDLVARSIKNPVSWVTKITLGAGELYDWKLSQ